MQLYNYILTDENKVLKESSEFIIEDFNNLNEKTMKSNLKKLSDYKANEGTHKIKEAWYNYQAIIQESDEPELLEEYELRNELESKFPWLKTIRGEETDIAEPFNEGKMQEEESKKVISSIRNKKVRTVEDSIADLAKMNSLLFSCISAMYGTMSDTAKSKIDEGTKELIDYSVEKFSNTQTRADRQLIKEGTGLVDKLFEREVQIADIIDEVKGE